MPRYRHISVAVPVLAESENLPQLLSQLRGQTFRHFTLYICVNNEEGGFGFDDNQVCLRLLQQVHDLPLVVIDRSSVGKGWTGKKKGVGWARKLLFERIMSEHDSDELVVSLDADTAIDADYLESVLHTMNTHPASSAFAVPYYHPLSGSDQVDRSMLRYECYMRHYLINLLLIHNPYAFTALGSAIVFPLWAYRRVGGITPLQGGEDFYLLQKFAKTGVVELAHAHPSHSLSTVKPQGRFSHRVPFGTGPAVAGGLGLMADRYPFYSPQGFAAVKATYDTFPALYLHDCPTPMSAFLQQQLCTDDLWQPLRRNFHTADRFIHACTERVDGLRILQFLKSDPAFRLPETALPVNFLTDPLSTLQAYRNQLFDQEMQLRQQPRP